MEPQGCRHQKDKPEMKSNMSGNKICFIFDSLSCLTFGSMFVFLHTNNVDQEDHIQTADDLRYNKTITILDLTWIVFILRATVLL